MDSVKSKEFLTGALLVKIEMRMVHLRGNNFAARVKFIAKAIKTPMCLNGKTEKLYKGIGRLRIIRHFLSTSSICISSRCSSFMRALSV
jgi:hypothetical protein